MPTVSVIVPIYNADETLAHTLDSIQSQTFTDFEVLMLDDCSTDRSKEIMDRYESADARFRSVHLASNHGAPAGPRNIGIDMAKGQWVAFLDSDDIWHQEKIERQLDVMKDTEALFSSTSMFNFSNHDDLVFPDQDFSSFSRITFDMQLRQFLTPTSSVVVSRSLVSSIKFNESLKYKAREDVDCFLRCHELMPYSVKIDGAMLAYRIREGQISGDKIAMVKRHFHVLKNYRKLDGTTLGIKALWFTMSHFARAIFPRLYLKRL